MDLEAGVFLQLSPCVRGDVATLGSDPEEFLARIKGNNTESNFFVFVVTPVSKNRIDGIKFSPWIRGSCEERNRGYKSSQCSLYLLLNFTLVFFGAVVAPIHPISIADIHIFLVVHVPCKDSALKQR